MKTIRSVRSIGLAVALALLPSAIRAEVSVVLDEQGQFKRLVVQARGRGFWSQARPGLAPRLILNPLGDNRGDGRPVVQLNPLTGAPWVFWPMNVANQKRIAYSLWNGKGWNEPTLVVADPGSYYYDELDPAAAFGPDGSVYLVWARLEQEGGRVYFSTMIGGRFSPPIPISADGVSARKPSIAVQGLSALISYRTPAGPVSTTFETAVLVQSAANLMDTPLPPGQQPGAGDQGGGGSNVPSSRKQRH